MNISNETQINQNIYINSYNSVPSSSIYRRNSKRTAGALELSGRDGSGSVWIRSVWLRVNISRWNSLRDRLSATPPPAPRPTEWAHNERKNNRGEQGLCGAVDVLQWRIRRSVTGHWRLDVPVYCQVLQRSRAKLKKYEQSLPVQNSLMMLVFF